MRPVDAFQKIKVDQTRTEEPVKAEEQEIDFRKTEHLRIQELVKKIEIILVETLHADLQQNNVFNLFNKNSKTMIRELGNVEFDELCETIRKIQCPHCLLYWKQGIVYDTCGQYLITWQRENILMEKSTIWLGMRGKYAVKNWTLKMDILWDIHDRFLKDRICRESQLVIGWTEQKCIEWDELAEEDHVVSLQRKRKDTKENGISP